MEKKLKNIIIYIGLILCIIVFCSNLIITSKLYQIKEIVSQRIVTITQLLLVGIVIIIILLLSNVINKIKIDKSTQKLIFATIIICYIFMQIFFIYNRMALPKYDQENLYTAAVQLYNNGINKLENDEYFEIYPHQLTLVFIYLVIFKIFHTTSTYILQIFNALSNGLSLIAVILITNKLKEEFKINKVRTIIIFLSFLTLPLLCIFIYGDLISFPMCLFAIYYIIKYRKDNKIVYAVISSLFISIAYMERMNSLIFIIAIAIYIVLDILENRNECKKNIFNKLLILAMFIVISIIPAQVTKTVLLNKLNIDNKKTFPKSGWICMGMLDGYMANNYRPNGWFNDEIAQKVLYTNNADETYKSMIKDRIKYFAKNPINCLIYYVSKTNSMWTENTYGAIWYNISEVEKLDSKSEKQIKLDNFIMSLEDPIVILQKAIILIIFGKTILIILQNKDKLTNEALLLILIFIGGFLFHTIWEAKSRYIIPYILILIPLTSIETKKVKLLNLPYIRKEKE